MKRNLLRILPLILFGGVLGLAAAPAAFEAAKVDASTFVFSKVTKNSDLAKGDRVILVDEGRSLAATKGLISGDSGKRYIDREAVTISGTNASFDADGDVCIFTLDTGKVAGSFALQNEENKYLAPYALGKAGMKYETSISNASSWTIDVENATPKLSMKSNIDGAAWDSLIYLMSNGDMRMYKSSSGCSPISIYKYSSGDEQIQLNKTEVQQNVGTTFTLTASGKGSYVPESYVWSIEEGSEYVSLSTTSGSSTVVTFNYEGSAVVKCVADGKADATCTINVTDYQYNILEKDKYFIAEGSGLAMLGSDLSYIGNVDFSDESNLWTLEKAYQGDNSYYVTNGEQYLAYNRDIPGHEGDSKESKIALTDEPINAWSVSTKDTNYVFSTITKKGQTRSLAVHEETWYAFEGTSNYVKFLETGEFDDYVVDKLPTKTKYYVGEKFSTTNMKITGYYTNGYSADITNKIVWEDLAAGTQAHGKFTYGEDVYEIVVNGISVLGPKAGSMVVTGLKDTYLIGEMPKETIEEVKVTYSDGVVEEVKTLKDTEYNVSPDKISSSTTKIVISMVNDLEVKFEKEITPEHAKYFATNMIEIGDKVTLGTTVGAKDGNITGGQEIAMVDGALNSQAFGYLPTPAMEFTVKQGVNSGTYAFEYNGAYLRSNGKTLDLGDISKQTATKFEDLYEFDLPYNIDGNNVMVHFTEYSEGSETFWGYYYNYINYDLIQAEAIIVNNTLAVDYDFYAKGAEVAVKTSSEYECEFDGTWVIYLPTSQELTTANSFTCNYVESQNDWVDDYWEICPVSEPTKHVYLNADSGKFGVSNNADYEVMLYRDMTKDFSHEIKSISVSIPESMPKTVELGEPYNWVGITVKAKYDNTTKKLPLGAYEVDVPSTDTYGEKTCTVTYGTSGNIVTATFKFTVVGGYQPFIKQNTYEVWVDDTNTFTTTQEPPEGKPVTWSSSDPTIANFEDPSVGDLTSYKSGKVTIKVTSYDGYYSDTSELTVSQRPTGLTLSETEKTIKQGEKFTITGTVSPADAKNKTVLWSSSDPDIATVSSKGEVTGLGIGDVVITGQTQGKGTGEEEGYKATCTVHVEKGEVVRVTGVSLIETKEIEIGASATLTPIIEPSNATEQSVTWESKYPEIVTVDKNGKITGKKKGTSDVTVTTLDGGFTATCRVTVKENVEPVPVSSISFDITSKTIDVDETFEIVATINPVNADDKHIDWSSSDEDVVEIISAGPSAVTVKGISDGEATITARTNNGKTATCKVTVGNPVIHVSGVSLDKTSCTLSVNETVKLNATVNPNDAQDKSVTWSSSNPSVATVDINGNVTAVAKGTATITVTTNDGGKIATCTVTVSDSGIPVQSVTLNTSSCSLFVNDQVTLLATVNPSDATDKTLAWSSSNPSVATVDKNGNVTAVAKGTATITVTTNDGGKTATCVVEVTEPSIPVESVTLSKSSCSLSIDDQVVLSATVNPSDATDKTLTWSSSNVAIATVDSNGVVKAISEGVAIITVSTSNGKTAQCQITVTNQSIHVDSVSLDKASLDLTIDAEADLVATINPTNASNKQIVWTSTDTRIVTVDQNGHVKAIGAGQATITVYTVDGNKTATCVVKVSSKSNSVNPVVVVAATGGTVAAVGIGCGVGIPLGIKAKKRKLLKK